MAEDKKKTDGDLLTEYLKESTLSVGSAVANEIEVAAVEEEESEVRRLPLDSVPIDLPLPCPLYAKVGEKYIMFRKQGDRLTLRRVMALHDKKVEFVYLHKKFWEFFVEELEKMKIPDSEPAEIKVRHLRSILAAYGELIDQEANLPKKPLFDKIKSTSFSMAGQIFEDRLVGIRCIYKNTSPAMYFINHAVNSAIFSALIAKAVGFSLDDVKLLVYAAVIHDVGNVFVPKRILYKPGKLDPEEFQQVKEHTVRGAEFLQSLGSPPAVVTVALQHHERSNGEGYPQGLRGEQIHPFAKIVAIADVFDAILSDRPHKGGASAEVAIQMMTGQEGLFDRKYLGTMFNRLK